MKVYYVPEMVTESGGYSPSGDKPQAVLADWLAAALQIEVSGFSAASIDDLCLAHDRQHVHDIFKGLVKNGHGNTLRSVTDSTLWTVGSMVAAARDAMGSGNACSPTSGFHHACHSSSGGFCTFNGLMVAAIKLRAEGLVKRVGVLDCDWHYGNGTDSIIRQLRLHDFVTHRSSGSELFVGGAADYFEWLERSLDVIWQAGVDLVLYQAGADAHRDDPLGGLLDDNELARRDAMVFEYCHSKTLPVAWCLAGGYQRDELGGIAPVLAIHRRTMECALKAIMT